MAIEITQYESRHTLAVHAFNDRLHAAGVSYTFPGSHLPSWLPRRNGSQLYQEYFLALENGNAVRGAYILKHQEFTLSGETIDIGCIQLPLSEGIVDKTFAATGIRLIADAVKRQPLLFALGIGGRDEAIGRLLAALGWNTVTVPFYFRVANPKHFLRNISFLRGTPLRRTLLDALATTGLGGAALRVVQLPVGHNGNNRAASFDLFEEFSAWSDELWAQCATEYALLAVRDRASLNTLYPRSNDRLIKLKITKHGAIAGWVVLLDSAFLDHKQFGNMRVGTIVDCLAKTENAPTVMWAATQFLEARGVDLLISNQLSESWGSALKENGFISGPSNFLFVASKALVKKLDPFKISVASMHINRGDGDGPIHL